MLAFACCLLFGCNSSQDPETTEELRNFPLERGFSTLLLFCKRDAEDPKEDAQHYFEDAQQRVIPVVRARGRQYGKLRHASETSGQLRGLGQQLRAHDLDQPLVHVGQERLPALLPLVVFLTPITGKFYVKLLALEDMRCLGLESISGLGSFLLAWRCVHPD